MTTKYEVTYIIKSDIDDETKKAVVDKYDKVIVDNGVTMVESKDWGKRCFAHEINRYREGTYHITIFIVEDAKAADESGRLSKINNQVLRSTTVKLDK